MKKVLFFNFLKNVLESISSCLNIVIVNRIKQANRQQNQTTESNWIIECFNVKYRTKIYKTDIKVNSI